MHQSHRVEKRADSPTALDAALLRAWPLPVDEHGDKLARGTVLVVAGSTTTAGAALLAGTAALRMGAGRLQIATAAPVSIGLSVAMPEAMVLPLPVDDEGEMLAQGVEDALGEPVADAGGSSRRPRTDRAGGHPGHPERGLQEHRARRDPRCRRCRTSRRQFGEPRGGRDRSPNASYSHRIAMN